MPSQEINQLLQASVEAKEFAYVPYSNFRVGAALLCDDGSIVKGCNVENASYGAGICAERTALVSAVREGKKSFKAIAVSSDVSTPSVSPCGICRQFIREFCGLSTPIYMIGSTWTQESADQVGEDGKLSSEGKEGEKVLVMMTLGELLPMSFGPEFLGKKAV